MVKRGVTGVTKPKSRNAYACAYRCASHQK